MFFWWAYLQLLSHPHKPEKAYRNLFPALISMGILIMGSLIALMLVWVEKPDHIVIVPTVCISSACIMAFLI